MQTKKMVPLNISEKAEGNLENNGNHIFVIKVHD